MKLSPFQGQHIKSIEWAIWLSQVNFSEFTEGDWLTSKEGLYDFIFWQEIPESFIKGKDWKGPELLSDLPLKKGEFLKTVTPEQLGEIRDDIRTFLTKKAHSDSGFYPVFGRNTNFAFGTHEPSQSFVWIVLPHDRRVAAQFALGMHLVGSGITAEQIRRCPRCQNLFLSKRRSRKDRTSYCSSRCAVNAATQNYRNRKAEELKGKERQRSRRRHREKQQRKYGKNVKIAERQRKNTRT